MLPDPIRPPRGRPEISHLWSASRPRPTKGAMPPGGVKAYRVCSHPCFDLNSYCATQVATKKLRPCDPRSVCTPPASARMMDHQILTWIGR